LTLKQAIHNGALNSNGIPSRAVEPTNFSLTAVRGNVTMPPVIWFIPAFAPSSLGSETATISVRLAALYMALASGVILPAFIPMPPGPFFDEKSG
jgi:hypothetical protein